MITTHKVPYRNGELRIGWASWDDGSMTARSIKYAYPDSSGKISRGSPELPFDILVDMLVLAADERELAPFAKPGRQNTDVDLSNATLAELSEEKKKLSVNLVRLQGLVIELPWADWKVYDEVWSRLEAIKVEIAKR